MKRILPILGHIAIVSALLFIALYPVTVKSLNAPAGTVYPAIDGLLGDYYWYLSVMRQGRTQTYETNLYSTEQPGGPSLVHGYYLLLGAVAGAAGIPDYVMYHLSVAAAIVLSYAGVVAIARQLLPGRWEYAAVLYVFFSSDLPQAICLLFGQPSNVLATSWIRLSPYFKLTLIPHHGAGVSLTLIAIALLFSYQRTHRMRYAWASAMSTAAGNLFFSIPGLGLLAVLFPFALASAAYGYRSRHPVIGRFVDAFAVPATLPGYSVIMATGAVTVFLSYWQVASLGFPWSEILQWESVIFGAERFPMLFTVLVASVGLSWLTVIPKTVAVIRKPTPQWLFILMLLYLPFFLYAGAALGIIHVNKARFVLMCLPHTLGLVSAGGTADILRSIRRSRGRRAAAAVLAAAVAVPLAIHLATFWIPLTGRRDYYTNTAVPVPYITALRWVAARTQGPPPGIMVPVGVGMYAPAYARVSVFAGHEVATDSFWAKKYFLDMLYGGTADPGLIDAVIRKNRVSFLLWDTAGDPLVTYPGFFAGPLYTAGGIRIYRVMPRP